MLQPSRRARRPPPRPRGDAASPTARASFAGVLGQATPRRRDAAAPVAAAGTGRGARWSPLAQAEVGAGRAAAGLQRLPAHRRVPHGHRRQRRRPVVRLLRLLGRQAGRRAARRAGPGLRRRRGDLGLGAAHRPRDARRPSSRSPATSSSGTARHIGIVESVAARRPHPDHRGQLLEHGHPPRPRRRRRRRHRLRPSRSRVAGCGPLHGEARQQPPPTRCAARPGGARTSMRRGLVRRAVGHDGDEAAAHVEDAPHLLVGHVAEPLHEPEDGGTGSASSSR